ncbi:MAG: DUF1217 domain-containing protein [Paracoccus sp. (in: a-proteobacteria)]|uniref:DUF1217 domain-containing protein n=1 Tax=Paracoccus sp. TaxID=267 RepID=UPI0039E59651
MTYDVQLGSGGFSGWKLLEKTQERQQAIFAKDRQIVSAQDYFSKNLPAVQKAEYFVKDYKLLSVALRAFGLDADLPNKAYIKKVLESDPSDKTSFVNRISDKRYLKLNMALGFGGSDSTTATQDSKPILNAYVLRSFEKNIGERYQDIELALNAKRELPELASSTSSENAKWYQIIASKPLRLVMESALGLSSSFTSLPVERQLTEMKTRFSRVMGTDSLAALSNTENLDKLVKTYLIRSQLSSSPSSPRSVALTLLRS